MIKKLLVVAALAVTLCPSALLASTDQCRRLDLSPAPYWSFSGTWSADGSSLMLVDVVRKALIGYPTAGGDGVAALGSLDRLEAGRDGQLSLLQPHGAGFLLEGRDGQIQRLTADLSPVEDFGGLVVEDETAAGLRSLDSWQAVGDDSLLLYGDYRHFTGRWLSVFARVSLDDPGRVELLKAIPAESPVRRFYLNSQSYLASAGGKGYFLFLGDDASSMVPEIWEMDPAAKDGEGLRRLGVELPSTLRKVTMDLPEPKGAESVKALFAAQERAAATVGLVGHGDLLYLLSRQPTRGAGIHWTLTVIEPATDRVLRTLHLPSRAPHLLLVPGEESWALVEKGRVEGFGVQKIDDALLLPSDWFVSESSPLLGFDQHLCR